MSTATVQPTVAAQRVSPGRPALAAGLIAAVCLAVQAVHSFEHVLQFGYWIAHPTQRPWMTPWAMRLHAPLMIDGNMALGLELLHLIGNSIFFAGLVALAVWYRTYGFQVGDCRPLRNALAVQGVHLVEHVALTLTAAFAGTSIGVSTYFGLVDGSMLWTTRVWFHFVINIVASWYAARAVVDTRADTVDVRAVR